MKTVFSVIILTTLLLSVSTIQAQKKIQGEFKVDYVPMSNYIRPIDSLKTDSKSDFKKVEIAIEIPLSMKMDHRDKPRIWSIIGYGGYAKMQHKDYEENLLPEELLNAYVGVKHFRSISDSWSLLLMGTVGVYTDMTDINKDAILGQGGVFFIKHFNPNLSLGAGPVLTNSFGVPMVLPGIYLDWETRGDFYVKVTFPKGAEAGYKFTEAFTLSAAIDLQGMTAIVKQDNQSKLLGLQQIVAGVRPVIKFSDNMVLSFTAGSTLVRSFSYNERKLKNIFKEKKEADPRFSTTFYAGASLKWSL
ncbi:DUF6268 family outer membrane beta-barrel protein [Myroides marinus]|uniref:DUF6268 domain-containing protein n=1 Tax=Myroides marinus TaxID=703342 RepID=A0A1H6UTE5_9FLAO|nr:DUF6268 family outer membrane beta-barrel protein [Myroides marinus]MDM1377760.1 hypothetical protein [Myroides marinus]MDM1385036.1 hypothetical protein [Myroides marinus]MDM1392244.1 hypothetical protein [Myroides marinus]SEI94966.1 hypothetical protein SAMN04488018_107142 [Myroides marinus]